MCIWIQTIIHKYAKFPIYIARMHITKITSSAIHIWPKIHPQRGSKWPLESKTLHTTTHNNISSKSFAYIGILFFNNTKFPSPLGSCPCIYMESQSWSPKDISQHPTVFIMKFSNPSVKNNIKSFRCWISDFAKVKGTLLLRSWISSIHAGRHTS